MRPDASENSQINPSTIVRAAGAAGSQPHLASGFQGRCKIATLHAGFGVIRGMSVKLTFHLDHSYRVLKSMTLGRFPNGGESDSTRRTEEVRHVGSDTITPGF